MSDFVDRANEHSEVLLLAALEAQRRKACQATGGPVDAAQWQVLGAAHCEAPRCGNPIPTERRRAVPGVRFCVACQSHFEGQRK